MYKQKDVGQVLRRLNLFFFVSSLVRKNNSPRVDFSTQNFFSLRVDFSSQNFVSPRVKFRTQNFYLRVDFSSQKSFLRVSSLVRKKTYPRVEFSKTFLRGEKQIVVGSQKLVRKKCDKDAARIQKRA